MIAKTLLVGPTHMEPQLTPLYLGLADSRSGAEPRRFNSSFELGTTKVLRCAGGRAKSHSDDHTSQI